MVARRMGLCALGGMTGQFFSVFKYESLASTVSVTVVRSIFCAHFFF